LEKCQSGNREGNLRAVKMIRKAPSSAKEMSYYRELEAVAKFSQSRVSANLRLVLKMIITDTTQYRLCFVQCFGWYEDDDSIYIAMEYCPFGDLHRYLSKSGPLSTEEVQELMCQILEGLRDMHDNGFAHRDLKPAVS
jgi:serine/threonine protein kinase